MYIVLGTGTVKNFLISGYILKIFNTKTSTFIFSLIFSSSFFTQKIVRIDFDFYFCSSACRLTYVLYLFIDEFVKVATLQVKVNWNFNRLEVLQYLYITIFV